MGDIEEVASEYNREKVFRSGVAKEAQGGREASIIAIRCFVYDEREKTELSAVREL